MNDRMWRHVLSTANLDTYSIPVDRVMLPQGAAGLLHRVRELLAEAKFTSHSALLEDLAKIVALPPEIPRADYRVWPAVSFRESAAFHEHGIKGGGARNLLFRQLFGVEYPLEVRDIDAVRFGTKIQPIDRIIAERFMPRDAQNGAGVELLRNLEDYFATRDLSVNEVLWNAGRLTASGRAIVDMASLVLRPSKVYFGSLHRPPGVRGRTVLKMVRLAVEGAANGIPWKITGLPDVVDISEFDLAIELGKTLERGETYARSFVSVLNNLGMLPTYGSDDLFQSVMEDLHHFTIGERAPLVRSADKPVK